MPLHFVLLWLIILSDVTAQMSRRSTHKQEQMTSRNLCHGSILIETRSAIAEAIYRANLVLQQQKELNIHYRDMGHDNANNPDMHMPKTCHQHYAVYSHLRKAAEGEDDAGAIIDLAVKDIAERLDVSVEELRHSHCVLYFWYRLIAPFCTRRIVNCNPNYKFRTIDGSCNNVRNPLWGRSNRQHRRLLEPVYEDGVGSPRIRSKTGELLPSTRSVSNAVHQQSACCPTKEEDLSQFVQQWGQLLDHDITDTAFARGADNAAIVCCDLTPDLVRDRIDCLPIAVAPGDERFHNQTCLNFVRSTPTPDDMCNIGKRNQLNQATSFIDASFLYGHNDQDGNQLRSFSDGKMKMSEFGLFRGGQTDLIHCELSGEDEYCMKSGDFRIHEMPGLTAVQVLLLREHNRIASELQKVNPHWTDEELYQETRKIVIGELQHITFTSWLPIVLGQEAVARLGLGTSATGYNNVYNNDIDPTITNIFSVAAFRFGHTLLRDHVLVKTNEEILVKNENAFNRPALLFREMGSGTSHIGQGLMLNPSSKADGEIVGSVRDNLFLDNDGLSTDLVALNIQRGRDHGVPSYNEWRRFCGLSYAFHFQTTEGGLVDHSEANAAKLNSVYRSVDDIDVFSGGISETPLPGAVVGPVFNCIIGLQFQNLKFGDRFYYENEGPTGFTNEQLNSIKKMTLNKLICLHFNMTQVPSDPFRLASVSNKRVSCSDIEDINFGEWRSR